MYPKTFSKIGRKRQWRFVFLDGLYYICASFSPVMKNRVDEFMANPRRALFILAGPVAIAMFVQTMYNIVDTAFIGRLGAASIAALTFAFPIFFILISLNSGLGVGINSIVSRLLGAKNREMAENAAAHGILMTAVLAIAVYILGRLILGPLYSLFGADQDVRALSMSYMTIVLLAVLFMFPAYAINSIFVAQGDTRTPMKIQALGFVLNAILDPIFIYPLRFGVRGAAIATDIAIAISLLVYVHFLRKRSYLRVRFRSFRFSLVLCREIFRVGAPASLMMLTMSIYVMFLNRFMAHFGTGYVASFGLATRLESFVSLPIFALSISLLTLVGMFQGAKRYDLAKSISWYGVGVGVAAAGAIGLLFYVFPAVFLKIFTQDRLILMIGSAYLRVDVLTFPTMAMAMIVSRVLQGMGFGFPGFIINAVRIFFVAVPLAYMFVFVLGYGFLSIAWAMVAGGVTASVLAFWWMGLKFRGLKAGNSAQA
jgi:putative MATE family efflux protein